MQETQYYKLKKPGKSDYADVAVLNENAEKTDAALHGLETGKAATSHSHTAQAVGADVVGAAAAVDAKLTAHAGNKSNPHGVTAAQAGAVPVARKVNGKALSADVTLTAADVGARPSAWVPAWGDVTGKPATFVPSTHTHSPAQAGVGKALTFAGAVTGSYDGTTTKTINIPVANDRRAARYIVGTSAAGWTARDCDYLCDGAADQVEINAAIAALPATGGRVVLLDGAYNLTAPVTVNKACVTLEGQGNGTRLVKMWAASSTQNMVTVSGADCTVSNMSIDGNMAAYPGGYGIGVTGTYGAVRGVICTGSGILVAASGTYARIVGNAVRGTSISIKAGYCTVDGNTVGGWIGVDASNCTVSGNVCHNGSTGITIDGSYNSITANIASSNGTCGIQISGNNCIISANQCCKNPIGINVGFGVGNVINGNTCNENTRIGIVLAPGNRSEVSGNICKDNGVTGIEVGGTGISVVGNIAMRGTGTAADYTDAQKTIWINGCENCLIANNLIPGKNSTGTGTNNAITNNKYN